MKPSIVAKTIALHSNSRFSMTFVLKRIYLWRFYWKLFSLYSPTYYLNTSISIVVMFDKVCELIQIYFKKIEYKRIVLSKWNMTTLKPIIEQNMRKLMKKYFQLLIKNICYLQYGLDAELYINKFIYNKLINLYQDIRACQYVYFKLADSLASLINNLRLSIITFQKTNLDNMQTQTFFIDQRYHK